MPFCSMCGKELKTEDVFCPFCGSKSDFGEDAGSGSEQVASIERPEMSKEESIALADKLSRQYKAFERLNQEIRDNEAIINRPSNYQFRPHAAFKFFWPFLIYAFIAFWGFYFIFLIVASARNSGAAGLFFALLTLGAPIALIIIGGVRAVRLRETYNRAEMDAIHKRKQNEEELKKRTNELRTKKTVMAKDLNQYSTIVPSALRASTKMERVKSLIQTGKAENFYDAIDFMLKH